MRRSFYLRILVLLVLGLSAVTALAQTGPGGVGSNTTNVLWLRANDNVYTDAGVTLATNNQLVQQWNDQSGNAKNASQVATDQPTYRTNILNGFPTLRFTTATTRILSTGVATGNSASVWAVAQYSSVPTNNPGIIQASPAGAAFSTAGADKVIGVWVSGTSTPSLHLWGRGVQSNSNPVNFSQTTGALTAANTPFICASIYNSTSLGMQQWYMGTSSSTNTYDGTLRSWSDFGVGNQGGTEGWRGDIAEVVAFNTAVNNAQRIIIDNYLSAKYGLTLSANDLYTQDNGTAPDNYDYDVAGIGRFSATETQTDSRGSGFVRISNPTDLLSDGEYLFWGHNNLAATATNTTDIPAGYGLTARFTRVWRVDEIGEVGNVDIAFDVTGLSDFAGVSNCDAANAIRLLIDTNNDGNFADQTPISGATNIGGNVYRFANVSALNDNYRFTIAVIASSVTGPGGVGGANGTTSLKLWLDAAKGVSTTGANVNSWTDQSGNSIVATPQAAGNRPTLTSNALNGLPVINFASASSQYLQMSANISAGTPSMFTVVNKPAVGSGRMTMLALTQNQWTSRNAGTDQWGMLAGIDITSNSTLNSTYGVLGTLERAFNDIDFYTNETLQNRTTGTALTGKTIGTIGSSNTNSLGTGTEFFNGNIAELAVYNVVVNSAQRIIVDNYLAAKYGLTLNSNDIYTQDNAPNNFDYDVAGIGRVNVTNQHSDARGTGILRVSNPSSLGDGDYLLWGHNNLALAAVTTDVPTGVQAKFQRIWAVNEVNEVGTIDMQFDLSSQSPVTASDLRLIIDVEGNGIFNEGSTIVISGAVALSCSNYLFSAVPAASLGNNMRFTIGTANKIQTPLPIELLSFYATADGDGVGLHWTTATEHNSDYFSIERSLTGEQFSEVLNIRAAGNSAEQKSYSATDNSAPLGRLYYRLKSVDYDGKYSISKIVVVDNLYAESKIIVSPNPVRIGNDLEVRLLNFGAVDEQNLSAALYDLLGQPVSIGFEKKTDNLFAVRTNSAHGSGFYILKIKSTGWTREYVQRIYLSE